jgi:hypothetical protein
MAIPDAATVAAKWASRAGSATEDYRRGIQNTDVDPTERAIAALPYAQQRYVAAIQSGKTANALRRAGKAGWQQGALGKGHRRLAVAGQVPVSDRGCARVREQSAAADPQHAERHPR